MTPDLSVHLGHLALKNPIGTASGTFGYGLEFAEQFHYVGPDTAVQDLFTKRPLK